MLLWAQRVGGFQLRVQQPAIVVVMGEANQRAMRQNEGDLRRGLLMRVSGVIINVFVVVTK